MNSTKYPLCTCHKRTLKWQRVLLLLKSSCHTTSAEIPFSVTAAVNLRSLQHWPEAHRQGWPFTEQVLPRATLRRYDRPWKAKLWGEKRGSSQHPLRETPHCPLEKWQFQVPSFFHRQQRTSCLCAFPVLSWVLWAHTQVQQGSDRQNNPESLKLQQTDCSGASRKKVWKLLVHKKVLFIILLVALQQWRFAAHHQIQGEEIKDIGHWKWWNNTDRCWFFCSKFLCCL